jgi:hypothetical protein
VLHIEAGQLADGVRQADNSKVLTSVAHNGLKTCVSGLNCV